MNCRDVSTAMVPNSAEVKELKLKEESREVMWKNAAGVYDLKSAHGFNWRA